MSSSSSEAVRHQHPELDDDGDFLRWTCCGSTDRNVYGCQAAQKHHQASQGHAFEGEVILTCLQVGPNLTTSYQIPSVPQLSLPPSFHHAIQMTAFALFSSTEECITPIVLWKISAPRAARSGGEGTSARLPDMRFPVTAGSKLP